MENMDLNGYVPPQVLVTQTSYTIYRGKAQWTPHRCFLHRGSRGFKSLSAHIISPRDGDCFITSQIRGCDCRLSNHWGKYGLHRLSPLINHTLGNMGSNH